MKELNKKKISNKWINWNINIKIFHTCIIIIDYRNLNSSTIIVIIKIFNIYFVYYSEIIKNNIDNYIKKLI